MEVSLADYVSQIAYGIMLCISTQKEDVSMVSVSEDLEIRLDDVIRVALVLSREGLIQIEEGLELTSAGKAIESKDIKAIKNRLTTERTHIHRGCRRRRVLRDFLD